MRILSIDGGGIRGIIPATLLVALERLAGRPIHELFDGFVGTSTGGIIALGLVCPQAGGTPRLATEIRSLYLDRGRNIFPLGGDPTYFAPPKSWKEALWGIRPPLAEGATMRQRLEHFMGFPNIRKMVAPLGSQGGAQGSARYPKEPLETELRNVFGETRMSEALKPVVVVSCDFERQRPLLFQGGPGVLPGEAGDPPMAVAARATSAAPTYFPGLSFRDGAGRARHCVDGGLVANDPAFIGYTLGRSLSGGNGRVVLVSLGTGEPTAPGEADLAQIAGNANWLDLLPPVIKSYSEGPGALNRSLLAQLPELTYLRVQPMLGDDVSHAMDDVRPENIAALLRLAERFAAEKEALLAEILAS